MPKMSNSMKKSHEKMMGLSSMKKEMEDALPGTSGLAKKLASRKKK